MSSQKLYKNIVTVGIILFTYIAILLVLTNEGLKSSSPMIKHDDADLSRTVPLHEANFDEIKINKNLLDIE